MMQKRIIMISTVYSPQNRMEQKTKMSSGQAVNRNDKPYDKG